MPIYDFEVPDGRIISLESDTVPTEAQVMEVYKTLPPVQAQQPQQPEPQPETPLDRLKQQRTVSPEQMATLPTGTAIGSGLYVYDRQPGQPEMTSAEGFRRAAMTQAPTVATATDRDEFKLGGVLPIPAGFLPPVASGIGQPKDAQSVFLDAAAREASKRDFLRQQEEGIGSSALRDVGEVFGKDVLTEQYGAPPREMVKTDAGAVPRQDEASFASAFPGEVAAWYADLAADPLGTARYNPVEAGLEVIGLPGVARGITKLRAMGKAKEADAAVDAVKTANKAKHADDPVAASRAGLDEPPQGSVLDELLEGTVVASEPAVKAMKARSGVATEALVQSAKADEALRQADPDRFLGERSGAPVRSLRKRDIDRLRKGGQAIRPNAPPHEQLLIDAMDKGLDTAEGAAETARKMLQENRVGTLEETAGVFARLTKVAEEEALYRQAADSFEELGQEIPEAIVSNLNSLGQEIIDLSAALSKAGTVASDRLKLQNMRAPGASGIQNLIKRATAQKGAELSLDEVSVLNRFAANAVEIQNSINDVLLASAKRQGKGVSDLIIDGTGIPVSASGKEVDDLMARYGALERNSELASRVINRLNPNYGTGASGFVKNNFMALATIPKMIMAGADLSSRLRQGIWGHIVAPMAQMEGWRAMMKSAKPGFAGKVRHPTMPDKLITSRDYALLSQRKALTGMYEGISKEEAARQQIINKFLRQMDISFTGIGDVRDPLNVMMGKKPGSLAGLDRKEELFIGNTTQMLLDLLDAQLLDKGSRVRAAALTTAKGAASALKKYGEFSERTFAIGLNHDRRNAAIRLLGLEDLNADEMAKAYDAYMDRFGKSGFKSVGDLVNITYGRGNLLDLEKAGFWNSALNMIMFSPRFAMSRFQNVLFPFVDFQALKNRQGLRSPVLAKMLDPKNFAATVAEGAAIGLSPAGKNSRLFKAARKLRSPEYIDDVDDIVVREAMLAATRVAAAIGLANLAGDTFFNKELFSTDMSSGSDWLKLKTPGTNTRLDLLGGLQGPVRLLSTLYTGKRYNLSGDEAELDKDFGYTRYNEMGRFMRQKMSPQASFVWDRVVGKDFKGEETDLAQTAAQSVTPIIIQDMIESGLVPLPNMVQELYGSEGSQLGLDSLLVLPAIFGVGYSDIKPKYRVK
tara:strand:- start:3142 stop:6588 length:3447 start_codon:yes stop_codon:yes gene_type:complete